jgi:hypothetical protein
MDDAEHTGKNSTTSTKNNPMKDIQFSVWLEM